MDATLPPPFPTLPGFEHIQRVWISRHACYAVRIMPGEYYVTASGEAVTTTLGSCIAACVRDRVRGIGGMNHFMLPQTPDSSSWQAAGIGASMRYGNYAMEHLINGIMSNGGCRENLEVKIFGGGRILEKVTDVGLRNIEFVRKYLAVESLPVVAEDVGDVYPRMVIYFPATGRVQVKRLRSLHNNLIATQEMSYGDQLKDKPVSGEVELF
ncbi:MAG TPA: chemoreceptor glutamine deamidase CheD [Rhodocyclaceae bacterium]|nr:chemoreceptor glutamine deamidase CheD [Rhodocyclaceae bacterium]